MRAASIALILCAFAFITARASTDFICPFEYRDYLLQVKPCGLGTTTCRSINIHPNREEFFNDACEVAAQKSYPQDPKIEDLTAVADWDPEILAGLGASAAVPKTTTLQSTKIKAQKSTYQQTNPLFDMMINPEYQNDQDAMECISPKVELDVCNYSWAYATKAMMDAAYNKDGEAKRKFSLDFIKNCLFKEDDQCNMRDPEAIMKIITNGRTVIPFEEEFDYQGISSCENYVSGPGYGGIFSLHTPEQPNRGGLMNLISSYPTMVLVGVSMEAIQTSGSAVEYSEERGIRPIAASSDTQRVYAIAKGYTKYADLDTTFGVTRRGMWFLQSRPMACFSTRMNVPMLDNETNGNFGNIATFAVGLSFEKKINTKVTEAHAYWANYNVEAASLTFDNEFCADRTIDYKLLADFDYLELFNFAGGCKFTDLEGNVVIKAPATLPAIEIQGGYTMPAVNLKVNGRRLADGDGDAYVIEGSSVVIHTIATTTAVSADTIIIRDMPKLTTIYFGNAEHSTTSHMANVQQVLVAEDVAARITTLFFYGRVFENMVEFDFRQFPNLQKVHISGFHALYAVASLDLRGLNKLTEFFVRKEGAMGYLSKVYVEGAFKSGADTVFHAADGAISEVESFKFIQGKGQNYLWRISVTGFTGSVYTMQKVKKLSTTPLTNIHGFYYVPKIAGMLPSAGLAYHKKAYFYQDYTGNKLENINISCGLYSRIYVYYGLTALLKFSVKNLVNLEDVEVYGPNSLARISKLHFTGSFLPTYAHTQIKFHVRAINHSLEKVTNFDMIGGNVRKIYLYECWHYYQVFTVRDAPYATLFHIVATEMGFDMKTINFYNMPNVQDFYLGGCNCFKNIENLNLIDFYNPDKFSGMAFVSHALGAMKALKNINYCPNTTRNQLVAAKIKEKLTQASPTVQYAGSLCIVV